LIAINRKGKPGAKIIKMIKILSLFFMILSSIVFLIANILYQTCEPGKKSETIIFNKRIGIGPTFKLL